MNVVRFRAARIASQNAAIYLHATNGKRWRGDADWLVTKWRALVYARRARICRMYTARRAT